MQRISIFLIIVALIVGMVGCDGNGGESYILTITSTAGGSVTVPGEGDFVYDEGTVVNLTAEPEEGYSFINWTGNVTTISDVYMATANITMNGNYSITANFIPGDWHILTISSTEGGEVITPGEGAFTVEAGSMVLLEAQPEEDHIFINWTGDTATLSDANAAATTITVNDNYAITANFVYIPPGQFGLTISSSPGGSVTTPGEDTFTYDEGTVVDLVANPDVDYRFDSWTGDAFAIANDRAATTTITMNGHYFIIANFTQGYFIEDWYDLYDIRYDLGALYILTNDLDADTPGYDELAGPAANGGQGWEPIGTYDDRFTGTFDGRDHKICDLYIYRPATQRVGLFSLLADEGILKNVNILNAAVTGYRTVGSLVGENHGVVDRCYADGSMNGDRYIGGMVGQNNGTVSNCGMGGDITGDGRVGGLIAENYEGIVCNCYAVANVTGSWIVGGLVGGNYYTTVVSNSYAGGNVAGGDRAGGLIGENGWSTVSNCYATGEVTGSWGVGGLIGLNDELGIVEGSFWDTETSGQDTSDGGTGKNTTEMQDITTFFGATWDIVGVVDTSTRNIEYIWNIVDDETYPFLSWE